MTAHVWSWVLSLCLAIPQSAIAESKPLSKHEKMALTLQIMPTFETGDVAFEVLHQMAPELKLARWTEFFKAKRVDLKLLRLNGIRFDGRNFWLPGSRDPFTILDDGRIQHNDGAFALNLQDSPEANLARMKKVWKLKPLKVGLLDLLLPQAQAEPMSDGDVLRTAAFIVIAMGYFYLLDKTKEDRNLVTVLLSAGAALAVYALFKYGEAAHIDLRQIRFSCANGITNNGVKITDQVREMLPGEDGPPVAGSKFTPRKLFDGTMIKGCSDPELMEGLANRAIIPAAVQTLALLGKSTVPKEKVQPPPKSAS